MTISPDELRERLQKAIEHTKIDATEIARRIGRSPEYVRDFLNGRKNSLKANDLLAIEGVLGITDSYLTGFGSDIPAEALKPILRGFRGQPPTPYSSEEREKMIVSGKYPQGEGGVPIYSSDEDSFGNLSVSTMPFEWVSRPWFLREAREGFAVLIAGEALSPAFEPGDTAIINPRLPLVRNRNVVLTKLGAPGSFHAMIGRLTRWTGDLWGMRRFDHPEELEVSRMDWPYAFRIAGRIEPN